MNESPKLGLLLERLRAGDKQLFLLTNSPFGFVDAGMRHILRDFLSSRHMDPEEWVSLFDIVICSARKPSFYSRDARFRLLDRETGTLSFKPVSEFKRGEVYTEGGLKEFMKLTGTRGPDTLYMGDHVWADLIVPTQTALWKTAAIIREIAHDTDAMNSEMFQDSLRRVLEIEAMLDYMQHLDPVTAENAKDIHLDLKQQRMQLRSTLKEMFNKNFGSVFRTRSTRSMFFFNVARYCDIYTSSITNILDHPIDASFVSDRVYYPHEPRLPKNQRTPPPPATVTVTATAPAADANAATTSSTAA